MLERDIAPERDAEDGGLAALRLVRLPSARTTDSALGTSVGTIEIPPTGPVAEVLRRERVNRRLLATADAVSAYAATLIACFVTGQVPAWPLILVAPSALLVAKVQGLYDHEDVLVKRSSLSEWRQVLQWSTIDSIGVYLVWRLITNSEQGGGVRLFLFLTIVSFALCIVGRALMRRVAERITPDERCVILGEPNRCIDLAQRLHGVEGVELVGTIATTNLTGAVGELHDVVNGLHAHRIVIVPHSGEHDGTFLELIRNAKLLGVRVSIMPNVLAAVGAGGALEQLDGLTLLGVPRFGLSRSSKQLKRVFDLLGATCALIVAAPFVPLLAVLIKLDSPGPVLFRQSRIGRGGEPFEMFKFRSMVDGADALKREIAHLNEASSGLFKIAADPRITRVGHYLRRTHIDELPQLLNVVRGEMSLVGPRPLVAEEDALITGSDRYRLQLTPGITGPWQIRGPMSTPLSEMTKLDYLYVSNWSLWQDVDILLKTTFRVLDRGGH